MDYKVPPHHTTIPIMQSVSSIHESERFHALGPDTSSYKLPLGSTYSSNAATSPSQGRGTRFVAGEQFFNYQNNGALRAGAHVSLWSWSQLGLVLVTIQSTFVVSMLHYLLRPTIPGFLKLTMLPEPINALESQFVFPTAFSIFVGILSDVLPLGGYRRKSYMILGSGICFVMLMICGLLSATVDFDTTTSQDRQIYLLYLMVPILIAVFGTVTSSIAVDARIVELSQCEPLHVRGRLFLNIIAIRSFVEAIVLSLTNWFLKVDFTSLPTLTMPTPLSYILMALFSLVPIPFLLITTVDELPAHQIEADIRRNLITQGMAGGMAKSKIDIAGIYRLCQQRVVWRLVLFLTILFAATRFELSNVIQSLYMHGKFEFPSFFIGLTGRAYLKGIMILVWKYLYINHSWRKTVGTGIAILISAEVFYAGCTLFGGAYSQSQFIFVMCLLIPGISDGVFAIFISIPATEIAESGAEGATIGLLKSLQSIVFSATSSFCQQTIIGFNPTAGSSAKGPLVFWLIINYGVHCFAFISLSLLPKQKLDAQQLRVYGGYSQVGGIIVTVLFVIFFFFALLWNWSYLWIQATSPSDIPPQ